MSRFFKTKNRLRLGELPPSRKRPKNWKIIYRFFARQAR